MVTYIAEDDGFLLEENAGLDDADTEIFIDVRASFNNGNVSIDSGYEDGQIETATILLPDGWYVEQGEPLEIPTSTEEPPTTRYSYVVYNAAGSRRGTIQLEVNGEPRVVCFAQGTEIQTRDGPVPVEKLQVGMMVCTRDAGDQPIRWIGSSTLGPGSLSRKPRLRPVRIPAGALGLGMPAKDLVVSPQHRVLLRAGLAREMFGSDEVLVPARLLCGTRGIAVDEDCAKVTYYHILFDRHEIVTSNGAETESLHTGPQAMKSLGKAALDEVHAIFPELKDPEFSRETARDLIKGRDARDLVRGLRERDQPLVSAP